MNTTATFSTLADTGLLRFSGPDAQTFLQGQLSCDVAALNPMQATYGSYNTPKGRMLASFVLWRVGADYFMQLPRALCEPIRKRLSMYILRSKVQAADLSDAFTLIGIAGAQAEAAVRDAFAQAPGAALALTEIDGGWVLRLDAGRFEVIAQAEQAARLQAALGAHAEAADAAFWDLATIQAGIPVITPATQEEFVPQMANLDLIGGVSFSKGCYPGQEIVARMHYLGKLKQRMVLAHVESTPSPQPGDKLYSTELGEQAAGTVVNAAAAQNGGFDVLAVVQTSTFNANGLHLGSLVGPALQMHPLPYPLETPELPKTKPA
jgi:folate-binding protein YgfZ